MNDKALPTATSPPEQQVVRDVAGHGWHVIKVPAEADTPGWAYTIGLWHNYGHPELIVFGLPHATAHAILNIAGDAIKAGRSFEPDVACDDFLHGYRCMVKRTDSRWHQAFVGFGAWFYARADFPLMQLFWPDRYGTMPWAHTASADQQACQPLLHERTPEAARVVALLASMEMT